MESVLSINEVAGLLGVSVQTLRNWDESGYLVADRTVGNHRRYKMEDVLQFRNGGRNQNRPIISCYEIDHAKYLLDLAKKTHPSPPIGGFQENDFGVLLHNQQTAHDNATRNLPLPLLERFARELSSPYWFRTTCLLSGTALLPYERLRGNKWVRESEECVAVTYAEDASNWHYISDEVTEELSLNLVKWIDENNISNILNNSRTLIDSTEEELPDNINKAINSIDQLTESCEPKLILYPPELIPHGRKLEKLNQQTKRVVCEDRSSQEYVSRLLPDNKVIIGTAGKTDNCGYYFCPYMLLCFDESRKRFLSRCGSKLLREGSKHYSVITVK